MVLIFEFLISLCLQEFMILPVGASTFKEAMKMGVEVYHNLKVSYNFSQYPQVTEIQFQIMYISS